MNATATTKRILLVEDSLRDAELTMEALAQNKLTASLDHVRDGAEALDYLYCRGKFAGRETGNPSVVLLDLKLPRVDGLEVLRQLKSEPALKTIPVVVMTLSREDQDVVRSYELGVNAYVVKSLDFHEFIESVGQIGLFWGTMNESPAHTAPQRR
jgi:CheY-like chemotaxis protein